MNMNGWPKSANHEGPRQDDAWRILSWLTGAGEVVGRKERK